MTFPSNPRGVRRAGATKRRAIPAEVQGALRARLERHVRLNWRRSGAEIVVCFRGAFAYVGAITHQDRATSGAAGDDLASPLFRLAFLGDVDRWTFALFKYSDENYELCLGASGSFVATPEKAFDCAARLYLS
jgi:hypothetical protein